MLNLLVRIGVEQLFQRLLLQLTWRSLPLLLSYWKGQIEREMCLVLRLSKAFLDALLAIALDGG